MSLPTEAQKRRSSFWVGVVLMLTGLGMIGEAGYAYKTGDVIHSNRRGTMEWWEQVPIGVAAILIGALSADWIKLGGKPKE